ncbi:hypothetical protein BO70DRAFT_348453 [Aspergillus heteromorphus CBS 117.55]|uniref:Uncharacterized protein n=1 Tax=Aspergillus heteromorphus CBS 117.55 TaxID=1448321 RepID=A0A317X610_9EURO|nr:uncharacterized protein BO70DRAFT_348453 [Aspergillus heteromorphus CBS 117.55]PWY92000.1 hypothetical protein BO70DRAFT_348453 [Aspergillus heteromorphus CBS 117.55]
MWRDQDPGPRFQDKRGFDRVVPVDAGTDPKAMDFNFRCIILSIPSEKLKSEQGSRGNSADIPMLPTEYPQFCHCHCHCHCHDRDDGHNRHNAHDGHNGHQKKLTSHGGDSSGPKRDGDSTTLLSTTGDSISKPPDLNDDLLPA